VKKRDPIHIHKKKKRVGVTEFKKQGGGVLQGEWVSTEKRAEK